jgi:hypothetical protein
MARARNIKPAFFQNEELGELQPIERLAFIGMWTIADFRGCIEAKFKRLKIQLLPYDDCDIETIVKNLEYSRFIRMYSVRGQTYIKIINFEKHQNPHKNERESGSEIPDISEGEEIVNEINKMEQDGTKPDLIGTTRADSLLLIPSSLNPDSLIPECGKKKAQAPMALPNFILPDWIPIDAWNGYVEMRKKIKKPMTDRAVDLKIKDLERFHQNGYDLAAILDKSTANNWSDLYTPKSENPSYGNPANPNKQEALEIRNRAIADRMAGKILAGVI